MSIEELNPKMRLHFRDQFRKARAAALRDAEAFDEIIHVVEQLGSFLKKSILNLGQYQKTISALANSSCLAEKPCCDTRFDTLYDLVREARNDAMHQGAFARHLTVHAVQLALVLEDALMRDSLTARDFMIRDPVRAELWQPISVVRQQMLVGSFSFIPVLIEAEDEWYLVSDENLAL